MLPTVDQISFIPHAYIIHMFERLAKCAQPGGTVRVISAKISKILR